MIAPAATEKGRGGLRRRIVIFFGAVLFAMTIAGLGITELVIVREARGNTEKDLQAGARVLRSYVEQRQSQLLQAARVLAADYAFREAFVSADHATIVSALDNHRRRIDADKMLFIGLDHAVLAASPYRGQESLTPPFLQVLRHTAGADSGTAVVVFMDRQIFQIVLVPVKAPITAGWVALAFVIDDWTARDLAALVGLEVSFMGRIGRQPWNVVGTSLAERPRANLMDRASAWAATEGLHWDRDDRLTLITALGSHPADTGSEVAVVIEKSLRDALSPFNGVRILLAVLALVGALVALLGTRIIAQREAHIIDLAYRDTLTGLSNRALFMDRLSMAVRNAARSGHPVSLLLLDLDRFKQVNDTLGHPVGDRLLAMVGERLRATLSRKSDTLARLGGDEFAILLPTDDLDGAERIAERIVRVLEQPLTIDERLFDVAASIGIASCPVHGTDEATIMSRADSAMYEAKRQRSGWCVYKPHPDPIRERNAGQLSLLSELRQAVEQDSLLVTYQPKLDVASGHIVGVEALVRWIHPSRGPLPPEQFIPYAELTGYIRIITQWVLGESLRQLADWRRRGINLRVAVNLSARDLLRPDLVKILARLLRAHGVPPSCVMLEVTENVVMEDAAHALHVLDALHGMGVRLAIDDFGTGYSSLAYLKRLPVDELKIDKSFVIHVQPEGDDAVIVRSTVDLAHNMGLQVVAEGVESAAALNLLRGWRCDFAQGYHISEPLTAAALEKWLASRDFPAQARSGAAAINVIHLPPGSSA